MPKYYLFFSDGQVKPWTDQWLPYVDNVPKDTKAYASSSEQWFRIGSDGLGSWWCLAADVPKEYKLKLLLLT